VREKKRTHPRDRSPTDERSGDDAKRLESRKGAKEETTTGREELETDGGVCEEDAGDEKRRGKGERSARCFKARKRQGRNAPMGMLPPTPSPIPKAKKP
jgi:hypothetical protein